MSLVDTSRARRICDDSALRYVSLRLLWDCNLRCIMCDHPHKPKSEMPVEVAHAVLDQLTHPVRLTFIGGEPCLWLLRHPEVLRRAMSDGHVVHLITNGVLLPRLTDFVDAFRDRCVSVQFSIDGYEQSYERIRKRSSWQALVAAIRLVNARRHEGNNQQAVITTNYLLMRSTLEDLPRFVRFCAHEGIDAISLTYAMIYQSMVSRDEITEEESVYHHKQATNSAVRLAAEIADQEGISLCYPPLLGDAASPGVQWVGRPIFTVAPGQSFVPKAVPCDKPWKEIFVNQDGSVVPCCCGPQIGPVIGNVVEGLEAVWNGDPVQNVGDVLARGEMHPSCRCGINISAVARQSSEEHFFTRARDAK